MFTYEGVGKVNNLTKDSMYALYVYVDKSKGQDCFSYASALLSRCTPTGQLACVKFIQQACSPPEEIISAALKLSHLSEVQQAAFSSPLPQTDDCGHTAFCTTAHRNITTFRTPARPTDFSSISLPKSVTPGKVLQDLKRIDTKFTAALSTSCGSPQALLFAYEELAGLLQQTSASYFDFKNKETQRRDEHIKAKGYHLPRDCPEPSASPRAPRQETAKQEREVQELRRQLAAEQQRYSSSSSTSYPPPPPRADEPTRLTTDDFNQISSSLVSAVCAIHSNSTEGAARLQQLQRRGSKVKRRRSGASDDGGSSSGSGSSSESGSSESSEYERDKKKQRKKEDGKKKKHRKRGRR